MNITEKITERSITNSIGNMATRCLIERKGIPVLSVRGSIMLSPSSAQLLGSAPCTFKAVMKVEYEK
ncbi:hypothetical protein [Aggregatibacter actinomycetemcomitans]|uniref:hypothetical protein n=1 Tax=Aggregatibacter actinomycetemcomitans TaxID=714 RepID=UPI0011DDC366|nr:hypothetical protein [Aggregatibacter actinomycetemcomitans]QEH46101.1 hypothetical protein FXN58_11635 [Aggregatibacter actinomycetemcomitans]QEH50129.1 hypothetical protein FXN57_11450 [Aggregatibacter actinomycetemcomitans]